MNIYPYAIDEYAIDEYLLGFLSWVDLENISRNFGLFDDPIPGKIYVEPREFVN